MKPPLISTSNLIIKQEKEEEPPSLNMKKLNSHFIESVSKFPDLASKVEIKWLNRFSNHCPEEIYSILSDEFSKIDRNSISFSTNSATLNFEKNRYRDVLPWDYNRVKLIADSVIPPVVLYNDQDYINASFIQPDFTFSTEIGFEKSKSHLIATQGPLPDTIMDFWTLVYNQNISCIYNLTREEEGGRVKCCKYWPNLNQEFNFSQILRVVTLDLNENSNFSIYSLSLSFNGVEKRITYYHFKDWPDHSGSDSKKVLKLLKTCLPIYKLGQDRILVHCSAGVGRTGVPLDTKIIDLTHYGILKIPIAISQFTKIHSLVLRQNKISVIENLKDFTELEELDLYDNQISEIQGIFTAKYLDLSFNKISKIQNLPDNVQELFLIANGIQVIENLSSTIRNLELGDNKIRNIQNLQGLDHLQELWLGKNKISKLNGLSGLSQLRILSLQSNRIVELEGLEDLENLQEFYISHNGILEIKNLDKLSKLKILDLSSNRIQDLKGLENLQELEELWISNNQISSFDQIKSQLEDKKCLTTVYFEGNPVQAGNDAGYRLKLLNILPRLLQIDATTVRTE